MATSRLRPLWQSACLLVPLAAVLALTAGARAGDRPGDRSGDRTRPGDKKSEMVKLPPAFTKPVPENLEDLKQIQAHVKTVIDKVMPAVVNIKVGAGQGSGVIVTEDGYVLTAGHVSQTPGKPCIITFPDGKEVKGKTLGWNKSIDSGMVKILDEGKYPHCEMGKSSELKKGEWAIAIGHPGGYKKGRTPPVRLGRILDFGPTLIRTDCVLVGGDSGGPLFDMQGKVIGINSRINIPISSNIHVPVDTFTETWERLVKAEEWSGNAVQTARLGLQADPDAKEIKITKIDPDSAAAKAGLKVDDIILAIDGKMLKTFDDLRGEIEKRKPGQEIVLQIRRGEETMTIRAVLGKS